ncbi:NAC domain-containing protein JA2-like [Telopea speciosissima]|uniref:NAC domain-containing protein JA2-like n=1 Tax=Telopea speciosissima TaxID=54955 RepID=UPI001CC5A8C7|nr:NAC domain-containing protein JA2-like [Telopea speciosissima]
MEMEVPSGYHFCPMNKEIIIDYLGNKLNGGNIPSNMVKEFDVYTIEPWLLPGAEMVNSGAKKSLYFSVTLRLISAKGGSRPHRTAGNGFWRACTGDKFVVDTLEQQRSTIGYVKQLTYHMFADGHGKHSCKESKKTDWIMHEYMHTKILTNPNVVCCVTVFSNGGLSALLFLVIAYELAADTALDHGLSYQYQIARYG